jgi:hypothetical protein
VVSTGFGPNIIFSAKILRIFNRAHGRFAGVYGMSCAKIANESWSARTDKIVDFRWLT